MLLAPFSPSSAQTTAAAPASIVVFPLTLANSLYDTTIQLTNLKNVTNFVRCFYRYSGVTIGLPTTGSPNVNNTCESISFDLTLSAQQPASWVMSTGRSQENNATDPGFVPAPPAGFGGGAVTCFEIDAGGVPIGINGLTGVATVRNLTTGDVAKYNGIGVRAVGVPPNNDGLILLDDSEYERCPRSWSLHFPPAGAADPAFGETLSSTPYLAVLPCTQNYTSSASSSLSITLLAIDEFELILSAAVSLPCWSIVDLAALSPIFEAFAGGGSNLRAEVHASSLSGGVLVAGLQVYSAAPLSESVMAAVNAHVGDGTSTHSATITTPVLP